MRGGSFTSIPLVFRTGWPPIAVDARGGACIVLSMIDRTVVRCFLVLTAKSRGRSFNRYEGRRVRGGTPYTSSRPPREHARRHGTLTRVVDAWDVVGDDSPRVAFSSKAEIVAEEGRCSTSSEEPRKTRYDWPLLPIALPARCKVCNLS